MLILWSIITGIDLHELCTTNSHTIGCALLIGMGAFFISLNSVELYEKIKH